MSEITKMTSTPKEKQSFSFSKENDGVTKTVRGEEVENGWVITISKEWYTNRDNDDSRDYHSETKKFVTTKDPRESKKTEDADNTSAIGSLINDIAGDNGMLIV